MLNFNWCHRRSKGAYARHAYVLSPLQKTHGCTRNLALHGQRLILQYFGFPWKYPFWQFWDYATAYYGYQYVVVNNECLLGNPSDSSSGYTYFSLSNSLCYTNWAIAAIAGFLSFVILFFSLVNILRKSPPARNASVVFFVIFVLTTTIYTIGAGYNTAKIPDANSEYSDLDANDPLQDWRNSILALSWVGFALGFIGIVFSFVELRQSRRRVQRQEQLFYADPQSQTATGIPVYPPPQPPQALGYSGGNPPPPPSAGFYPPPSGTVYTPHGQVPGAPYNAYNQTPVV